MIMPNKHALAQFAAGVLTALVVVVVIGWTVTPVLASQYGPHASTAPIAPAVPGGFDGQSPVNIPAAAFRADGGTNTHYFYTFPGGYMYGTGVSPACVMAPVYLPRGAVIDRVYANVVDNDATPDWSMQFRRVDALSGTNIVLASFSTTTHGTMIQNPGATVTANNAVPSQYFSYYLATCLTTNERLYGVRVYYDVHQLFSPLIER
jgi:hypothetical protein